MSAILQTSIFWFFAIIGFCEVVRRIIHMALKRNDKQDLCVLLTVKNEEETVEDKIRSFIFSYHEKKVAMPRVIIVDLDSTDHTYAILERLSHEYAFLYPMTRQGYLDYCEEFMNS